MENTENPTVRKLMESFFQFKRMNWQQNPHPGIKHSEMMLLFIIKRSVSPDSPGIKVSEISNLMKVTSPTITQLIKSLESQGLVERKMDEEDRRAVRIKLTDKGEIFIKKAGKAILVSFQGLVDYLGEEKSNELAELLLRSATYFNNMKHELHHLQSTGGEDE